MDNLGTGCCRIGETCTRAYCRGCCGDSPSPLSDGERRGAAGRRALTGDPGSGGLPSSRLKPGPASTT